MQHALAALDFVRLMELREQTVQSLSYGHQRLAEIARALAGNPKQLLLDEPGAGLNTVEKSELVQLRKRLKVYALTVLVIDHDMNLVEQVADRITVLNFGPAPSCSGCGFARQDHHGLRARISPFGLRGPWLTLKLWTSGLG